MSYHEQQGRDGAAMILAYLIGGALVLGVAFAVAICLRISPVEWAPYWQR